MESGYVNFLASVWDSMHGLLPTKEAPPRLGARVVIGAPSCRHDWLTDCQNGVSQSPGDWLNQVPSWMRLLIYAAWPQANKNNYIRLGIPRTERLPPRSQIEKPDLFLHKVTFFLLHTIIR